MTTVARVTFPSPDLGGQPPCPSCAGAGGTGETYTLQTSEPSCQGRTWWICQGFAGEGEDTVMHHLRVPCGCTEGQVQYVER